MYDTYHYKYFCFFLQNWEVTLTPANTKIYKTYKTYSDITQPHCIALHCIAVFEVRGALNFLGLVS